MKWFYGLYPTDRIKIKGKYYYITNFLPKLNILFSIWPFISNCRFIYNKLKDKPFKTIFNISRNSEIIADSGSFSFYRLKNRNNMKLTLSKLIEIYDSIKPNFAVHNDIPIKYFKLSKNIIKKKLLKKNLINAKLFLNKTNNKNYKPIGVAQGITGKDYISQILDLYSFGFDYIGIGGMAYLGSNSLNEILISISEKIKFDKLKIRLHIFGVGRLEVLKNFKIYSFDNTTPLNDSHRDKQGKRTYYYFLDKMNSKIIKKPLYTLQNQKFKVICTCPLCKLISNEILKTGSALRNHSRAFHNAFIYQKANDLINSQF